jgi:predicted alternative tryptophan synthase beta-subunit
MGTMIPDVVVGSVGFGSNFGAYNELALEKQVRELIRSNNRLIRVLKRCVKPSNEIASEAHDAIEEAAGIR